MVPDAWLHIARIIESRWGPSKKWDRAGELALTEDVIGLDSQHAEAALKQLSGEQHAPAPQVVIHAGYKIQSRERQMDRAGGTCRHPFWAIVQVDESTGRRLGLCINPDCRTEKWHDEARLVTAAERGLDRHPGAPRAKQNDDS